MSLGAIVEIVTLVWPVSEIVLAVASRARRRGASVHDHGSLALLWIAICVGISAGFALRMTQAATISVPSPWLHIISLLLLIGGLAVRWSAIITLGRFFSTTVAIHDDHRVITSGPYRRIRHPAYTGLLLVLVGFALMRGNWLSLAAIVLPSTAAVLYRIRVEEASLIEAFGSEYTDYCRSTRRLIPGLY